MAKGEMGKYLQTSFHLGEVGDRLNGSTSELYERAVKKCNNMLVSKIGSLRFFNKLDQVTLTGLNDLLFINDTKESYAFLTSTSKLGYLEKATKVVRSINTDVTGANRSNTFFDGTTQNLIVSNGTISKVKKVDTVNNTLIASTFLSDIKPPVQERTPLKVAFYRWGIVKEYNAVSNTYVDKKKLFKIGAFEDLQKAGTDATGKLIITGITIKRCYFLASTVLDETAFTDTEFNNNDCIVNFEQGEPTDLYLNGYNASFISIATDGSGNRYSTTLNRNSIPLGVATKGIVISLNENNVRDIVEYQNRIAILTDEYIFFSEKLNYKNFLNGVKETDAFYLRPTPIRNQQPKMRRLIAGKGLYINTDVGYLLLGFINALSSVDNQIDVVSDTRPTLEGLISDDILYFTDAKGVLYASYNVGDTVARFKTLEVDKFDIDRKIKSIDSINIDGIRYLVAKDINKNDVIYLYTIVGEDKFSRVSLTIPTTTQKVLCYEWQDDKGFFITGADTKTHFYDISDTYYGTATLTVLPPRINDKETGLYLNNSKYSVKRVVLKMLNQKDSTRKALKSVKINGTILDNITEDIYDTYILNSSFQFLNGFDIQFEHTGNELKLELLGMEIFFD